MVWGTAPLLLGRGRIRADCSNDAQMHADWNTLRMWVLVGRLTETDRGSVGDEAMV